jgi:predicted neuraminidase
MDSLRACIKKLKVRLTHGGLLLFFLIFTVRCHTNSQNFIIPDLAVPGENAYLSGELIFPLDDKPTPQCHASTIVETGSGMLAAWFGGTNEGNPDVGIWISVHQGGIWSTPVEVADGIQSDTVRFPCWNPVLFKPQSGPVMLFYKVGPNPEEWWGMLMISEDDGNTWSDPRKIGEGKPGHLIGPVKNKPVRLEDGTILCPSSTENSESDGNLTWKVHFELTKDTGKTWEVIGPVNDGIEFDAIQPCILRYRDGKMQVLCRTRQDVIAQSWSDDNGHTWDRMRITSLPNPNAGIDAVTLKDGKQLLVYNHTILESDFPSGRNMLNVAVSADGHKWKPVMTLERREGEYSYPAVIQTSDGLVHVTYTYNRQSIKYVVIDPGKIL